MAGLGWKTNLRRPAAPGRHGNSRQLRRVAARFLSPGPPKSISSSVERPSRRGARSPSGLESAIPRRAAAARRAFKHGPFCRGPDLGAARCRPRCRRAAPPACWHGRAVARDRRGAFSRGAACSQAHQGRNRASPRRGKPRSATASSIDIAAGEISASPLPRRSILTVLKPCSIPSVAQRNSPLPA
jgi:hypothetical protein